MRTKKQIEKMMIGMLLGGGCLLSSCHSVYMSAEDRLQGDYQEAVAEVELETVEELTAFAYSDVSVIPYTVENIARGFTDLSDEEIEKRFKELSYLKIPPREQAENKLILSMGESLYEETVGNLRKEVEFYLRKFESLLDNQDKNDISLAAKEIKEKFEAISNSIKCY